MTSIQSFYKHVLTAYGYQVGDDNLISYIEPGGGVIPVSIENKRLILPTKEVLRDGIGDEFIAFHPMSENIARKGASPVIAHMQRAAKANISYRIVEIATRLLTVAADQTLHKSMSGFGDFLKAMSEADKKSVTDFLSLISKSIAKNKLISLYLKVGANIAGKNYHRGCVIHFPIIELLKSTDEVILGIKLRKRDRKLFLNLFEIILPRVSDGIDAYSVGSNCKEAPFFDAFLRAYGKLNAQLNSILQRFGVLDIVIPEVDLTYMDEIDNLPSYHGKIPSLRGNEGVGEAEPEEHSQTSKEITNKLTSGINKDKPAKVAVKVEAQSLFDDIPPWEDKPAVASVTKTPPTGEVSYKDFMKSIAPQPPAQQPIPHQVPYTVHPMYIQQKQPSPFAAAFQAGRSDSYLINNSPYGGGGLL